MQLSRKLQRPCFIFRSQESAESNMPSFLKYVNYQDEICVPITISRFSTGAEHYGAFPRTSDARAPIAIRLRHIANGTMPPSYAITE
ncbi:hypothetical protein SLE2022_279250 [Rubroshorea leprosula]